MEGMEDAARRQLKKAKYGVFGHSAVQICSWTKKSLHNKGDCYKKKFYGADCHRCMEFTPAAVFCGHNCIFCWRPMEFMKFRKMDPENVDSPEEIYKNLLEERRKLLSGFPGDGITDMEKFSEALRPSHFAISLSGEPTMYPRLPGLVKFLKSLPETRTVFIVTNGQEPEMLKRLSDEDALPTQLYVSVNAPNEELFRKINCPVQKDPWKRFLLSLDTYSKMDTRRIMRMTMIKGINTDDSLIEQYAEMIKRANPHFIEVKAYMWLGFSRKRLGQENMPFFEDIKEYAEKLGDLTGFKAIDEKADSRIVLMQNGRDKIDPKIKR